MRHWGQDPLGFLGHPVAFGDLSWCMSTTALLTQSLPHASRSLFCIRNARHLAVSEMPPKWPWAEPSKSLLLDALKSCQGDTWGDVYLLLWGLGPVAGISPQIPREPISFSWEWACTKSWRMRGSTLPLLDPVSAPVLAEGRALRNTWPPGTSQYLTVLSFPSL